MSGDCSIRAVTWLDFSKVSPLLSTQDFMQHEGHVGKMPSPSSSQIVISKVVILHGLK